jgi:NTE family protein
MAYHAGVLMALKELGGFDAAEADLLVGTSAGSMVAAHLRASWSVEDLWRSNQGEDVGLIGSTPEEAERRRAALMPPAARHPLEAVARLFGSAWILSRSIVRVPMPRVPEPLGRLFPGGLLTSSTLEDILSETLDRPWPDQPLWLPAVDTASGRRVVFGRPGAPSASLVKAVMASCAVPGVFPPVKVGKRVLVDGGVDSTTHLDLAVKFGASLVIGVVPMAYDPADPPDPVHQLIRRQPSRWLAKEVAYARARGVEVLLLRPSAEECRLHGARFLRNDKWEEMADAAYRSTAAALATPRFRSALEGVRGPRHRHAAR